MTFWLDVAAWLIAALWSAKLVSVWRNRHLVPNLLDARYAGTEMTLPSLAVVVPARDEARDIVSSLQALMTQDYPGLRVYAVNDRSTDETGMLMRQVAAEWPDRLTVVEIEELPPGWLGKTHAMACAAASSDTEYLLFTDADVIFAENALRRSICCATERRADHLVTLPTTIIRRWDEAAMLGFFQLLGMWAVRLWKIPDADAQDALGVGAFNLIRREAYEKIGGFQALRMEIIEDIGLARRVKSAGLRSQAAFGRGLVSLHWASGAAGIVGVMTKNMFSAFRFYTPLLLLACCWLALIAVLPFAGLFWPGAILPAVITGFAIAGMYRVMEPHTGLSPWNALLTPFAAAAFIYAMLLSMVTTLRQGGVRWRGTFYSLPELRSMAAPLPSVRKRSR